VTLRQLLPAVPGNPDPAAPDLAALYAYPDGPWLRANMVSSADGAASLKGASAGLSSDTDRRLFALLRTLSDVILVGAATVRTERYKPARLQPEGADLRSGRTPTPPIAVVTRSLDLDPDGPLITAAPPDARTIVITTAQAPQDIRAALEPRADVIVAGQDSVDFTAAVAALADRGHRRLLAEGGPHLLGELLAAGLLDELCLTTGPLLAGPGPGRIVAGGDAASLPLNLAHVLEEDGFLFCRYTRRNQDH
jgi:riboflavin biosynthesis pyrimidine reductase